MRRHLIGNNGRGVSFIILSPMLLQRLDDEGFLKAVLTLDSDDSRVLANSHYSVAARAPDFIPIDFEHCIAADSPISIEHLSSILSS